MQSPGLHWGGKVLQANSLTSSLHRVTGLTCLEIPSLKRTTFSPLRIKAWFKWISFWGWLVYFKGRWKSMKKLVSGRVCITCATKILPELPGLFDVLLESVKSSLPWALWQLLIPTTSTWTRLRMSFLTQISLYTPLFVHVIIVWIAYGYPQSFSSYRSYIYIASLIIDDM